MQAHHLSSRFCLALCLWGLLTPPVLAGPGIDGLVSGLPPEVYNALQMAVQVGQDFHDQQVAKAIQQAVLADNQIDPSERDLLQEIESQRYAELQIQAPDSKQTLTFGNHFQAEAQKILSPRQMQALMAELDQLWAQGQEGFQALAQKYADPAERSRLSHFMTAKVQEIWQQSHFSNGYRPLRDWLGTVKDSLGTMVGENRRLAQQMVYDALQQVDRKHGDHIPNTLYEWLKP